VPARRHDGVGGSELTDGQGRALSAHRTQQSYEGYAKRNLPRALSATRKRHAHRLANTSSTPFRMKQVNAFRMRSRERRNR
jgi:hypothetical protein